MTKVEYDPVTKTYSCRLIIGDKDPILAKNLKTALSRTMLGQIGRWKKQEFRKLTDILFWFEEGIR